MENRPIEPFKEIVAYEALWQHRNTTFKKLSELFFSIPGSRPSDFVHANVIGELYPTIKKLILSNPLCYRTNILTKDTFDYPVRLMDTKEQLALLYYSGNLDFLSTRCIAMVGSRRPSENGLKRAQKLTRLLNTR
jgi:DNA processing protein